MAAASCTGAHVCMVHTSHIANTTVGLTNVCPVDSGVITVVSDFYDKASSVDSGVLTMC